MLQHRLFSMQINRKLNIVDKFF